MACALHLQRSMTDETKRAPRGRLAAAVGALWLAAAATGCNWPGLGNGGGDSDGSGGVPAWANPLVNACIEEGSAMNIQRRLTCSRDELQSGDTECLYFVNAPRLAGAGSFVDVSPPEPHIEHGGEDRTFTLTAGYLPSGTISQMHQLQGTVQNCRASVCTPHGLNARIEVRKAGYCP